MNEVSIDANLCDRSPGCQARRVCPKDAIVPTDPTARPGSSAYTVDSGRCAGCGICVSYCPRGAIVMGR